MLPKNELSSRFEEALVFAVQLHSHQMRKGSGVPYVSHLLSVAALVLEDGGSEDEAIAALLHDAVEDQGGKKTLQKIERRFGKNVARIVLGCTDTDQVPKPPWRKRKEDYVAHLRNAPADVRRVSLADKLHNSRTILKDIAREGQVVWERFTGGRDGTLWYYRALVDTFREFGNSFLLDELERVVTELEKNSNDAEEQA
jgi:(p)ppGpp synthase/HD superfamily hydrolase